MSANGQAVPDIAHLLDRSQQRQSNLGRDVAYQPYPSLALVRVERRVLIIVQNLPVPFDRRVWLECQALVSAGYQVAVVCPKGGGDPSYQVIDAVQLYKYRPYAPGGGKLGFVAEYVYSFLATARLALKARRSGRLAACPVSSSC